MGLDVSTERSRDRWQCSVVVRACREEGTTWQKARRKKKFFFHEQNPTAPQEGERHKASGRRGNGAEQKGQTGDRGWRKKKNHSNEEQYQQRRVTTWGKGKGNGGRGGQEEGPTTGPEGNTPSKRQGAGRGRPVLGSRTGPGKAADPVGPRQRVAGGQKKKTGCREKGKGQKRACG